MEVFCTIITKNFIPLAKTLYDSLNMQVKGTRLQALIVDAKYNVEYDNLKFFDTDDLENTEFFKIIEQKYAHTNADQFRWALKPVLIGHLLKKGYTKVIFLDPDLYFVNNFQFLFDLLEWNSVLLTPHWADLDVINSEDSVLSVLRNGLFNAGFIAASQEGVPAIEWWASMCHYKTEKRPELGIYDDQKYLDLIPVQFDNIHILKHQGCNLASWNIHTCKREMVNDRLLINKKFEPIFIHFAKDTIMNIQNRNDILLKPYLEQYVHNLATNGFELSTASYPKSFNSIFYKLKHHSRIRTRLKRWMYLIAERL